MTRRLDPLTTHIISDEPSDAVGKQGKGGKTVLKLAVAISEQGGCKGGLGETGDIELARRVRQPAATHAVCK